MPNPSFWVFQQTNLQFVRENPLLFGIITSHPSGTSGEVGAVPLPPFRLNIRLL